MLEYRKGNLFFAGHSIRSLAKKYGTPLYAYDLSAVVKQAKRHMAAFRRPVEIHYAMKANSFSPLLKALRGAGVGADVVSGGELSLALKCGFKPQDIIFSGVGKTEEEITLALKKKIKLLNVESPSELRRIARLAKKLKTKAQIGLRFNPDVNAETHPYITTGFRENKFGMDASFLPEVRSILAKEKSLQLQGLSLHIGSQLKTFGALSEAINKARIVFEQLRGEGHELRYFDVGGGVAISYHDDAAEPAGLERYAETVERALAGVEATVLCEPGRILTGPFGILITKVEYLKTTPYRNFVIVDTGMHHLLRPALYQAEHRIWPVREGQPEVVSDIVGPICESADFLARQRSLPQLEEGDFLAIGEAGAYGFTMASDYNLQKRPKQIGLLGKRIV